MQGGNLNLQRFECVDIALFSLTGSLKSLADRVLQIQVHLGI